MIQIVLRFSMRINEARSIRGVVQVDVDVKCWAEKTPTVEQVRPDRCPACKAASRPLGGRCGLHGHGVRRRESWGPPRPGAASEVVVFQGRRFQCQCCGAVTMVVPAATVTKRRYSGSAIAWALALFGANLLAPSAIRLQVSPWKSWALGWTTLLRWTQAAALGRLFKKVGPMPYSQPARKVAERVAGAVSAYALPTPEPPPFDVLAFFGAARAL